MHTVNNCTTWPIASLMCNIKITKDFYYNEGKALVMLIIIKQSLYLLELQYVTGSAKRYQIIMC